MIRGVANHVHKQIRRRRDLRSVARAGWGDPRTTRQETLAQRVRETGTVQRHAPDRMKMRCPRSSLKLFDVHKSVLEWAK